ENNPGCLRGIGRFFCRGWHTLVNAAKKNLDDPDVFRRMGAAAIWTFIFFIVAWLISFFLFKIYFLEKTWLVDKFFGVKVPKSLLPPESGKDPANLYWLRVLYIGGKIFLHYLVVMVIFVFFLNLFRVGKLNLGYVFLFAYAALMGVVTGTKSFPYYSSTRLTALITFARFSLWQILAFLLATVSTTGLAAYGTPGWMEGTWQKIRPFFSRPRMTGEDVEVLIYAFLILLASCIAEARLVVFYSLFY
ncbi:MAG: hypothetical protein GX493_05950, partial [Firmicutes bacterium]|nr:hypothetical protein [Bacillota bacterium]